MKKVRVATFSELQDRQPAHALVGDVDLVIIRYDEEISVLYGAMPAPWCSARRRAY